MSYVTWLVERRVAKGLVRVGIAGGRFTAELAGARVELTHGDIVSLADIAASRRTWHLVKPLRDGGYSHLLGGKIGLLPEEARILKEVSIGTPEGLAFRRECLVAALEREREAGPGKDDTDAATGLAHHNDDRLAQVSPTRQALNEFDRRHPQVLAAAVAARG